MSLKHLLQAVVDRYQTLGYAFYLASYDHFAYLAAKIMKLLGK